MTRKESFDNGLTRKVVRSLLRNKFVVIIGDSIQRSIYKDLVSLLQRDGVLTESDLRTKGEMTFMNDTLIEGGVKVQLNNGTSYTEVRQFQTNIHLVRFYFVTRCYSPYMESVMLDLAQEPAPDLVIMNSCLWDMTRYGLSAIRDYKKNLELLFLRLSQVLPRHCLMIWNTTMPISRAARGGFLVEEVEYNRQTLRMDVLEANYFARQIVAEHGFDVLDLHFWFRHMLHWRAHDGIHWCAAAHRRISELLLTHVATAWRTPFPPMSFLLPHTRPTHTLPAPVQGIPRHIMAVAERMEEEQYHRQPCPAPPPYHRPGPYPLFPSPPLLRHWDSCRTPPREMLHHRGAHRQPQCYLSQKDLHDFSMPQFPLLESLCYREDFCEGWMPYAEDSFRGPQRHAEYAGHFRYTCY